MLTKYVNAHQSDANLHARLRYTKKEINTEICKFEMTDMEITK